MESKMITARTAALAFAATFVGVGILGFVPNPLVAPDGVFAVNAIHNLVHVITGLTLALGAIWLEKPKTTLLVVGALYVVVAIAGFLTSGNTLLWLIHINTADRWLHLALAAVILAAGAALPEKVESAQTA
jgi:hypothetical protein